MLLILAEAGMEKEVLREVYPERSRRAQDDNAGGVRDQKKASSLDVFAVENDGPPFYNKIAKLRRRHLLSFAFFADRAGKQQAG